MIVFSHTKFGLVWIQGSGVKRGGGIRPPRSERVFQIPVQIGLKPGLHISRKNSKHMVGNVYFKMYGYGLLSLSLE